MIELGSSSYYLNLGEIIFFQDFFYVMFLIFVNDVVNVIVENIVGSIFEFVEKMNEYVKSIGVENFYFVNLNGFYFFQYYIIVYDLSFIVRQVY